MSTLNLEAIYSSETSDDIQRTTRRYIRKTVLFITTAVRTSNPTQRLFSLAFIQQQTATDAEVPIPHTSAHAHQVSHTSS
jgi:hypothetical protein